MEAEVKRLKRKVTDHVYMLEAFYGMLGPKGREVADMWYRKGVQRIHFDWGQNAPSGEERAQFILDLENAKFTELDDADLD